MIRLEEYYTEFLQDIFAEAESRSLGYNDSFLEKVCEELISTGVIPNNINYAYFEYLKGRYPMEVSGFAFDDEREILYVITSHFAQEEDITTLDSKTIEKKLKRARNFISKSTDKFYNELENTSDEFVMSHFIYDKFQRKEIDQIRILLISNGQISRSYKETNLEKVKDINISPMVVDISYLYSDFTAQNADSSFSIDIKLPFLQIPTDTNKYDSFLAYISGEQIYEIYNEHGKRLLEENVRTFLQFKGGVNKGIKNTIDGAPDMFFAYNNGITATASSVEFDDENNITRIHNLQIVNGGQTTSAIYAAKKSYKKDISKVIVQLKLSVINEEEQYEDFVSKIAEYANTQNKVNKSDFFSNSPFHKEFKTYSTSTWIPSYSQNRERWFYERVRGEYLNEQAYLSKAEKKKFELSFPRNKKIDKTFLSRSEMAWLQQPHTVSKGGQSSFLAFADHINEQLEKNALSITQKYYMDAISRVIIFRKIEHIISNSSWYHGGFRANVVAYTIAYFSYYVKNTKKHFDFNAVWEIQDVPEELAHQLSLLAEQIFELITNPPKGHGNPSQWSKKKLCWQKIKGEKLDFSIPKKYLISAEEHLVIKKEEKEQKKVDKGIEIQSFVVNVEYEAWLKIYEYFSIPDNRASVNCLDFEILESLINGKIIVPTERQSKYLYKVFQQASSEGLIL